MVRNIPSHYQLGILHVKKAAMKHCVRNLTGRLCGSKGLRHALRFRNRRVINWPVISWCWLMACVLAETIAVFGVFGVRVQRSAGLILIGIHIGILFTLNIGFFLNLLLLLRLIVFGPPLCAPLSRDSATADAL